VYILYTIMYYLIFTHTPLCLLVYCDVATCSVFTFPCSDGDTSSAKELMSELLHLCDVVEEDSETESRAVNGRLSDVDEKMDLSVGGREGMEVAVSSAAKPRKGAITCNSTEMVREKQLCTSGRFNCTCTTNSVVGQISRVWPAWALTWDINCIRLCYIDPWALSREWALAQGTTVVPFPSPICTTVAH
jgi:hypothetical protein